MSFSKMASVHARMWPTGDLLTALQGRPGRIGTLVVLFGMLAGTGEAAVPPEQEGYGASQADDLGPIGGGRGYRNIVARGDYRVKTALELINALKRAKSGESVYVDDKAEIDMTVLITAYEQRLVVPAGVTLASGRGRNGSEGALIYSDQLKTPVLIEIGGPDVRISGLRLRGPDTKARAEEIAHLIDVGRKNGRDNEGNGDYYRFPTSAGIASAYTGLVVDNCEIWGWSYVGVSAQSSVQAGQVKMHVHHNSIHHCQRAGLGYAVCVGDNCEALIEANLFDYTRHAVAATGRPGTCYEARNNVHGEHCTHDVYDMHGSVTSPGEKRDERKIAGEWVKIHHNTIRSKGVAVRIGGLPRKVSEVHHNWFFTHPADRAVLQDGEERGNMKVYENVIFEDQRPWPLQTKK